MARVSPDGWRELNGSGSFQRELETLAVLAEGLDDRYAVYHSVHWTRVQSRTATSVGEIDFVIVGPGKRILLIEQKAGFLTETPDGLLKPYANGDKSVKLQLARNKDNFHNRLRDFMKGEPVDVSTLLYCPDYVVKQPGTAGIDPARIVDGRRKDQLLPIITGILPGDGEVAPINSGIHRFLGEFLELVPDVNGMADGVGALQTRLSGGLAHWARRIDIEPFRLRVVGTAGSGKTQLALAVYGDTLRRGGRVLYVCYNRPLADHIMVIAPPGGQVTTYHQLADRVYRLDGATPDFAQPGAFSNLEAALNAHHPAESELVDTLIVDEGQDFQAGWAENLLRFLRPGGRAWWLEDPMQNLYGRPPVPLPGWARLRADINYRSPKDIVGFLNRILPPEERVVPGSPLAQSSIEFVTYSDPRGMLDETTAAIDRCLKLGFKRPQVAIVSYRGRESSILRPYDRLGKHALRAPTGQYDLLGNSLYTDGDVLIDSVHRFKGRSAPCVIFTEIDFELLDDAAVRRLFVGATRATMKLIFVLSERAEEVLIARVNAER